MILIGIVTYVPAFVLTPRLVLRLRELYARDLRGGSRSDIDTAFGLTSSGRDAVTSQIIFARGGHSVGEEQGEERGGGQGEGQGVDQDEEVRTVDRATDAEAGSSAR